MKLFKQIRNQKNLYFIFVGVLMLPNFFLFVTEQMSLLTRVAFIAVPLAIYMAIMLLNRRPGILFWVMLPICVFGAFQLVLLYLFGNSIIAVDMFTNLVTTNSVEVGELLGKLSPAIIGVCVIYIPSLVLATYSIRISDRLTAMFRRRYLKVSAAVFSIGLLAGVLSYIQMPSYRPQLHIFPVNVFYNIRLACDNWQRAAAYHQTSADFKFGATAEHADSLREVYVVVVGETSRAANWSLYGYDRPTNPRLSTVSRMVCFTDLITQSNTTHKSVPILMTAASAENFDVIYTSKSLITAFKEAGFQTAYISNQRPNNSFIDFFGNEADYVYFLKKDRPTSFNPLDYDLLPIMDSIIDAGVHKQLIVLHTYGSHFNYRERYSDADRFFAPDNVETVTPSQRHLLVNAFDNSIRATDSLLYRVISKLDTLSVASAVIYTSDHGEDIYDDPRGLFLHASPIPSYYQLHTPGLIWVSSAYDNALPQVLKIAQNNSRKPMTSNMFFHTTLSIAGVATPYRNDSLSVVSERFTITPRHYLNDHNQPKAIDNIGLSDYDIEMFAKHHLQFP